MAELSSLLAVLTDLARRYPLGTTVALLLAVLWLLIHARPRRLDSSYEREHPAAWSAAKRRLDRESPKRACHGCLVWRVLAIVPLVGSVVRLILKGRLHWNHWRYPDQPGAERRIHMSRLCSGVWPDHHTDADKWRRAGESIPFIGRYAWVVVKPAFLLTAWISQLAILGGIGASLWFGIPPVVQFLAEHVTIHR